MIACDNYCFANKLQYRGKQPPPTTIPSIKANVQSAKATPTELKKVEVKDEKKETKANPFAKAAANSSTTGTPTSEKKTTQSTIPAKRTQADFFKRSSTSAAKVAPPKKAQNNEQKLESDDEEDVAEEPKVERDLAKEEAIRKKKKEDEEALKAMMEIDDDIEMEDSIPPPAQAAPASPDWEEPAGEEEPSNPLDKPEEPKAKEPTEIATSVSNGRRRGRRKVKKARTVRDEKGYLETKFEEVWESYSEDEPAPPPPKKELPKKTPAKKGKGGGGGQGSIMSFFGKKQSVI